MASVDEGRDYEAEARERLIRADLTRSRHLRSLIYDIAINDEFACQREWMGEQVALLEDAHARQFASKLWRERDHWSAVYELAAGAAVRRVGLVPAYEERWGKLTPDWTVRTPDGELACLVEVHTDQPPSEVDARIRGWRSFGDRFNTVASPFIFMVADGPQVPPSAGVGKRIVRQMSQSLMQITRTGRFSSHGYTFVVMTDPAGRPVQAPNGLRAQLAWPTPTAGRVSAEKLADKVDNKVTRYRHLANELNVPLVVAVGAEPFTGVSLRELDDLMTGTSTIVIQFDPQDLMRGVDGGQVNVGRPAHWDMRTELSGVLWLSREFPFDARARPNPAARRPMPAALAELGADEGHLE
jgi:hypothetical protein